MDHELSQEELQKEKKRAATRERVQRFREKRQIENSGSNKPPISGKERMRKYRIRKQQQAISIPIPLVEQQRQQVAKTYPSQERMRKYRLCMKQKSGYQKAGPLTARECSRRWYAKKQQTKIRDQAKIPYGQHTQGQLGTRIPEDNSGLLAQAEELRIKAYYDWLCLNDKVQPFKEEILESAMQRLKTQIKVDGKNPAAGGLGLQLDWNVQLYTFVKLQLKAEKQYRMAELER
ncbi:hypothetical protein L873DRAFT_1942300 [Choiromyces venosus 120613-1]|uniref:Uncharacterized protein n=1 Tax=Choiromyces venosus 120613-1 TaxID=1336337 RepID=A0A3N4J8S1_9PEZI|nr:hypothetical protein L873DRAFT_1942300 [Choiromyces venosus 120613-1]